MKRPALLASALGFASVLTATAADNPPVAAGPVAPTAPVVQKLDAPDGVDHGERAKAFAQQRDREEHADRLRFQIRQLDSETDDLRARRKAESSSSTEADQLQNRIGENERKLAGMNRELHELESN